MATINKHFSTADKIMYSVVFVMIVLIFVLGFIAYDDTNNRVTSIRTDQQQKAQIAYQSCLASKSGNTQFINSLIFVFKAGEKNARNALKLTPKTSMFYKVRKQSVINNQNVVTVLQKFLPIKCIRQT